VRLFDEFLVSLTAFGAPVFVISGNHDSAERVAFASRILRGSGVYVARSYDGNVSPVTLNDKWGEVDVFLLPFIKPAHVRAAFPEETIETWTDAVDIAVRNMPVNPLRRNVILAHQFITGSERSESEELSVGGADNVDARVFAAFDYVALGHLHGAQNVADNARYCGSPLKYSFSEAAHEKSVTVVKLCEKGRVLAHTVRLKPLRDMREVRGSYMEVTAREFYRGTDTDDYLRVTLTDEDDVPDARGRLRAIYPNLMRVDYDNARTARNVEVEAVDIACETQPIELFERFFETQNNQPMNARQRGDIETLMARVFEDEI
jgi:exonuclease SbcD